MTTYTLSIEDEFESTSPDARVVRRTIGLSSGRFNDTYSVSYNPNQVLKPLQYDGPFDNSSSIVGAFNTILDDHLHLQIAAHFATTGQIELPSFSYDASVNRHQRHIFNNLLTKKVEEFKEKYQLVSA